jgi:transcriptional regulator NrdR family protein
MGKRYQCEQCDYQATQKGDLTKHHQSVHVGRKHTCQECGQKFTEKGSLAEMAENSHDISYRENQPLSYRLEH